MMPGLDNVTLRKRMRTPLTRSQKVRPNHGLSSEWGLLRGSCSGQIRS